MFILADINSDIFCEQAVSDDTGAIIRLKVESTSSLCSSLSSKRLLAIRGGQCPELWTGQGNTGYESARHLRASPGDEELGSESQNLLIEVLAESEVLGADYRQCNGDKNFYFNET